MSTLKLKSQQQQHNQSYNQSPQLMMMNTKIQILPANNQISVNNQTTSPGSASTSASSSASSSINTNESSSTVSSSNNQYQLASKLRKIKENLNNYNGDYLQPPLTNSSSNTNNNMLFEKKIITRIPDYSVKSHAANPTPFAFNTLATNKSSLDHILNQFKDSNLNNINLKTIKSGNTNFINNQHQQQQQHHRVVPIHTINEFNNFYNKPKSPAFFSNNHQQYFNANSNITNESLMKQAVYTENVSRQSSIRSLINSNHSTASTVINQNSKRSNQTNQTRPISLVLPTNAKQAQVYSFKDDSNAIKNDEIELLNNWKSSTKNSNKLSNNENAAVILSSMKRPDTRMEYQHSSSDINDLSHFFSKSQRSTPTNSNENNFINEHFGSNGAHFDSNNYYEDVNEDDTYNDEKSNQVNSNCNNNETESVLSIFRTSLNFEDLNNQNRNSNSNTKYFNKNYQDYEGDFDHVTNSDVMSEDASSVIMNTNNYKNLIIREKIKNSNGITIDNNNKIDFNNLNMNCLNKTRNSNENEDKAKNYQQLSSSINFLFSNLIQHLETQKNRDYLDETSSNYNNKKKFISTATIPDLNNNNSKQNSNKDSGYSRQESSSQNSQNNNLIESLTKKISPNSSNEVKPTTTIAKSEISLLERFLDNEQFIAFKHSQIDRLLLRYNLGNRLEDDYSLNEYILNQEGISLVTFKQLIKEKYVNFNWPDDLLVKLHEIVNQPNEIIENQKPFKNSGNKMSVSHYENNNQHHVNSVNNHYYEHENEIDIQNDDEQEEDVDGEDELEHDLDDVNQYQEEELQIKIYNQDVNKIDPTKQNSNNSSNNDRKLNSILKQASKQHNFSNVNQIESGLNSNSPSNSSKSYRKIKDIKHATSLKKKQNNVTASGFNESTNNVNFVENDENNKQDDLKKCLSGSFAKKRDRKGSLPEINSSHLVTFDGNNHLELQSPSLLSYGNNSSIINSNNLNMTRQSLFSNDDGDIVNGNSRQSRKSAFILEVMRTSMFRSKSLTDLNTSLVKPDYTNSMASFNHNKNRSSTLNKFASRITLFNQTGEGENVGRPHYNNNTSLYSASSKENGLNNSKFDLTLLNQTTRIDEQIYTGLIWQCADMCYDEYKNKYKELLWLMNGDRISTTNKLKEIEQRLKIELNLKEKNLNLLDDCYLLRKAQGQAVDDNYKQSELLKLTNQIKLIDNKIKDLESTRLFVKVCEMNSYSLDKPNLDLFFGTFDYQNNVQIKQTLDNQLLNNLQAKPINELLKTLYGSEAIVNGFVYQFFVVYRYMFSSIKLLMFFKDNFIKARSLRHTNEKLSLIIYRTIDLIAMWIDGFFIIDFQQNQELIEEAERFILNEVRLFDEEKSKILLDLLRNPNVEFDLFQNDNNNSFPKKLGKLKKLSNENVKSKSRLSLKRMFNNSSRTRSSSRNKEMTTANSMANIDINSVTSNDTMISKMQSFSLFDYPVELVATQLTLIEWDNFMDIHVCHCLNSKAQGINCDSKLPIDPNNINVGQCLFVDNYLSKSVYKMIQFNYMLTHWISAEILMLDNIKSQAALITKFIKIAKLCYKWSNFSTAFSIYDGLHDITIRNLPAWQHVANKTVHSLDKISSYRVLFQNEPKLINQMIKSTNTPVIPSMHLFLLLVQQNEHGNFQLINGQWKWSKLEYLASLVDQIRNTQQHYQCTFEPDEDLVNDLMQRIYYLKDFDLNHLAENMSADYLSQKLGTATSTSSNSLNVANGNSSSNSTIKNLISNRRKFNLIN